MNPTASSEPEQPNGQKGPSAPNGCEQPERERAGGAGAWEPAGGDRPDDEAGPTGDQAVPEGGIAASDRWPTADEQLRAAKRRAIRYMELPVEIRAERRAETVRHRELHRGATAYSQMRKQLDERLSAYQNDQFVDDFAREYFAAGSSRVLPRMCRERLWVHGEDKRRAENREAIAHLAGQLDAIDAAAGHDSAEDYNPRQEGPPPEDNHLNRAWLAMLRADLRLLGLIRARGNITWRSWLKRTALRAATPALLGALSIWSMSEAGATAWSAVGWAATMLGVWLAWTASGGKRDTFAVAVHDIWVEHYHTLTELVSRLRSTQPAPQWRKAFVRDPSQRPLTDLLTRR